MKRQNYPDHLRENWRRQNPTDYRNNRNRINQPRPEQHHHWAAGTIIVILLIILLGAIVGHHMNQDRQANVPQQTTIVNNQTVNQNHSSTQRPNVIFIEKELKQLGISTNNQEAAVNFYEKQNPKVQTKINHKVKIVNRFVPLNSVKKWLFRWILSN